MSSQRKPVAEPIAAVNKIVIRETDEPLVNIDEFCPNLLVPEPPQWVRRRVAEMLDKAHDLLPEDHRLEIRIGWRSLEYQQMIYKRVYTKFRKEHREWPENILRRYTNRYVAPPHAKAPPGHTTGGAVDLVILGPDGKELDFVSPFKEFREGGYETFSSKVTPEALKNRRILYDAMMRAGFSNCAAEWWHYSYGDSAWAVRTGRKTCCYGAVEAPTLSGREQRERQELSKSE